MNQILFGSFDSFFDCIWNFFCFSCAKTNMPCFIADYYQCSKRKVFTTFYYFGNAIDRN